MLILTEKPSVAKAFADALGVTRKDGYYENGEHCVVNALGHLLEDYSPEDYDPDLKKWSIESLPIIPETVKYKAVEKTKAQLAVVKNCFARHKNDPFLLATTPNAKESLSALKSSITSAFQIIPTPGAFGCPKPSRRK